MARSTVIPFIWDFGDSNSVSGTLTPTHSYADDGVYTVTLTVTDDDGGVSSDTLTVTVGNVAPVIDDLNLDSTSIDEGQSVTVSGSFSDAGSADTFTGTALWSDGASSVVTIVGTTFSTIRLFADDDPTATPSDTFTVDITITDDDGGSDVETSTVLTVNNVAPVVAAGADQSTDEGAAVIFGGSFTDVGVNDTHTIMWDFGDSNSVSGTLTPTHSYADDGVYTVTLTVTDDDGGVSSDTLTVTVGNVAPVIDDLNLDSTSIDEGQSVTVSGSFSDAGSADTFTGTALWSDGASSVVTIVGTTFSTIRLFADDDPTATPSDTFTVDITITDDDGGSDVETSTVLTVNNVAPVVEAGENQTVDEGAAVNFTGSFTDVGVNDTHTIMWDFGDSNSVSGTLTPTHSYADDGVYTVMLTVTDDDGGVSSDTLTVTVGNVAPVIDELNLDSTSIDEGQSVTVSGSFSDAGSADTFTGTALWSDGASSVVTIVGTTFTTIRLFADDDPTATPSDTFTVDITITDDDGGSDVETSTVLTVNNVAPVVAAGADQSTDEGAAVNFTGSFTDVGVNDTHTIMWDFGDSNSVSGTLTPTHSYADDGVYTVTLTVTDDDGGVSSDTLTVTVGNVAPVIDELNLDSTSIDEGQSVTVSGSFSDAGSADTFTGTALWSDGASSVVTIVGTTFSTIRLFADDDPTATPSDTFTVDITITDDDGGSDVETSTVLTVNNVAPVIDDVEPGLDVD